MIKITIAFLVSAFSVATVSHAQIQSSFPAVTDQDKHRTGKYTMSAPGVEASIYGQVYTDLENKPFEPTTPFVLEEKTEEVVYEVVCPESYSKDQPFGLFVWISPTDNGRMPNHYRPLLEKFKLIGVGTNKSGNDHVTVFRASYAIQAVKMLKQRYNVDVDRIYLSGHSGGGRVASYTMMLYPQVFSGGLPVCGANKVMTTTKGNHTSIGLSWIPLSRLEASGKYGRYAFLTGEKDFNKEGTQTVYEAYADLGFNYVTYIEEPGLGHRVVSAETMTQALEFVDSGLPDIAELRYENAKKMARSQPGAALLSYRSAIRHAPEAKWIPQAEIKVEKLVKKYDADLKKLKAKIESRPKSAKRMLDHFAKIWGDYCTEDIQPLRQ